MKRQRPIINLTTRGRIIYALSCILTALFCWVVFPYKWIKKAAQKAKLLQIRKQADERAATENRHIYVVQWNDTYKVGTRQEIRAWSNRIRADLARQYKAFYDFDYRHAIIYTAMPPKGV